ncbi:MAG TPA: hypothetical protein VJ747_09810 [Stellaceae bacterium]|nr:hypothetical protein [Stellaceae bacterium]
MWNEWLARTLRPRSAQSATLKPAPVSASAAIEETGMDELRLSNAALCAPAQDDEESSLAVGV